jgi:hypothetical protein
MLFGDPQEFAIEAYHEPAGNRWLGHGRVAIHIAGAVLGDLGDEHCSLLPLVVRLRDLISRIRTVWDASFDGYSDAGIFALIDRELYSDYGQSDAQIAASLDRYGRFDFLTHDGESFHDVKAFIYTHPTGAVHIAYQREGIFGSGICSVDSFVAAARFFLDWFDAETRMPAGSA